MKTENPAKAGFFLPAPVHERCAVLLEMLSCASVPNPLAAPLQKQLLTKSALNKNLLKLVLF